MSCSPSQPARDREESRSSSSYQRRRARGERELRIWLRAEEKALLEVHLRQTGQNAREFLLSALHKARGQGESCGISAPASIPDPLQEQLRRGELFAWPGCKDYLLLQITLDSEALPEWKPLSLKPLLDFDSAEAALRYYARNSSQISKTAQLVLLHRADADYLGFTPEADHWYYPAHIVFEIYPRIMNAFGDYEAYEALLQRYLLQEENTE